MDSGTTADLFSVCGSFSTYAVGENGTVRAYHNALGWFPRESGTTANLYGTPLFGNANYIVGGGGLVLHSSNGGIDWSPQAVGTAAALRDIQISTNNTSRLYAVGDAGIIIRTTNQGTTWGFQQSGTTEILHGVFFYLNDNQGWAVGENATILRTNDAGGPVVLSVMADDAPGVGSELRLAGYPNPFQSRATFTFHLDRPGRIALDLFDPAGRRIGGWQGETARQGRAADCPRCRSTSPRRNGLRTACDPRRNGDRAHAPHPLSTAGRRSTMSRVRALMVLCFTFFGVAACPELTPHQDLAAQVRAAEIAFAKTMADRNLDAFGAHVADEALFFSRDSVLRGKAAVLAGWKRFFEGPTPPFSWEPDEVEVLDSGTLANQLGSGS